MTGKQTEISALLKCSMCILHKHDKKKKSANFLTVSALQSSTDVPSLKAILQKFC